MGNRLKYSLSVLCYLFGESAFLNSIPPPIIAHPCLLHIYLIYQGDLTFWHLLLAISSCPYNFYHSYHCDCIPGRDSRLVLCVLTDFACLLDNVSDDNKIYYKFNLQWLV